MRVSLNQAEIFEALGNFVRSKWRLDNTASLEIDITAGRGTSGYRAEIEIIEPVTEPTVRCVAAQPRGDEDPDRDTTGLGANPHAEALAGSDDAVRDGVAEDASPAAAATKSADDIFN